MNADVELSMMDVELDAIAALDAELVGVDGMVSSFVNFDQSTAVGSKGNIPHLRKPFLMVDITIQLSNASRNIDVKFVRFTVKIRLDAKETIFT